MSAYFQPSGYESVRIKSEQFFRGHLGLISLILLLFLTGCSQPQPNSPESISPTVFAAASLTDAFTEIGAQFELNHPDLKITFNFAGSQQLAQQLNHGAPADVFASANQQQMEMVVQSGRILDDQVKFFTQNQLVVIYPEDNPAQLNQLQDLAQPGLRLILAANEVPVGRYTLDFLGKAGQDPSFGPDFEAAVLNNVVSYEQNVRAVLTKIVLGEGDAGVVYTSDLVGEETAKIGRLNIPTHLNIIAAYPIALINDTQHMDTAQGFVDYILSPAGQEILNQYGFITVDAP